MTLVAADEGTWFVPERIEVLAPLPNGSAQRLATWQLGMAVAPESTAVRLGLPLAWSVADLPAAAARFEARDAQSAGHWKTRVGSRGAWIPGIVGDTLAKWSACGSPQRRSLPVAGVRWVWTPESLQHPQESAAQPTCWFADDGLSLRVVPPDAEPYRLTLYVLDYDRNGRAVEIVLSDEFASLSTEQVSAEETAGGIYLTWTASGTVNVELKKTAGYNTVLSGVFVDPVVEKGK